MPGYEACSGCGICTLSCPVWWETRDVWFTPHGRARALQGGATAEDVADSVFRCRMCGACEPACPEQVDILELVRELRLELTEKGKNPFNVPPSLEPHGSVAESSARTKGRRLLAGPDLQANPGLLERVVESLGGPSRVHVATDDGCDIAWAYEAGVPLDEDRVGRFLESLGSVRELIVVEGILHGFLREKRPGIRLRGLADALLDNDAIASSLGPRDLLVIDARAYHADHAGLARRFTGLRSRTGCRINLDLQRLAIPTGAESLQARGNARRGSETSIAWLLEGRDVDRIVVESPLDLEALRHATNATVVHLASLAPEAA